MFEKLQNNKNALGWLFMMPAATLLLLFLTYPLGLGTWLGFTDAKVGRAGQWVGFERSKSTRLNSSHLRLSRMPSSA